MEYGILMAADEYGAIQIIGVCNSSDEVKELASGYVKYGPAHNCVVPERFIIHRRDIWGLFTIVETIEV